jgi:hypothetical protein
MAEQDVGRLLVVTHQSPDQLVGIITRSDLLKARRMSISEEIPKEKVLFRKPPPAAIL